MPDAMKENELGDWGDVLLATIPPLGIRVTTDPRRPRKLDGNSGTVAFTVGKVSLIAGGNEVVTELDRQIAWFLFRNCNWTQIEEPAVVEEDELVSFEYQLRPEQASGQRFESLGFLSQLISQQFRANTKSSRLSPNFDPRNLGVVIPSDFESDAVKLIRGIVHPASEVATDDFGLT